MTRAHAPIALFAFARPDHTRLTLEALARNPEAAESDLHAFCDGARGPEKQAVVDEVRAVIAAATGFRSVTIHARDRNFGLAANIIDGVGTVLRDHDRVIVVEDDLITSPSFLKYMNDGLDFYETDERVISLHGYVHPLAEPLPQAFFLRGADCWGWATWRRGWALFETDGEKLLAELERREATFDFDFAGTYPYVQMLRDQIAGRNNSWAIRWYASAYLADRLTLHPGRSFVRNIGLDGSGENCAPDARFDVVLHDETIDFAQIPVVEDRASKEKISRFLAGIGMGRPKRGVLGRLWGKIRSWA